MARSGSNAMGGSLQRAQPGKALYPPPKAQRRSEDVDWKLSHAREAVKRKRDASSLTEVPERASIEPKIEPLPKLSAPPTLEEMRSKIRESDLMGISSTTPTEHSYQPLVDSLPALGSVQPSLLGLTTDTNQIATGLSQEGGDDSLSGRSLLISDASDHDDENLQGADSTTPLGIEVEQVYHWQQGQTFTDFMLEGDEACHTFCDNMPSIAADADHIEVFEDPPSPPAKASLLSQQQELLEDVLRGFNQRPELFDKEPCQGSCGAGPTPLPFLLPFMASEDFDSATSPWTTSLEIPTTGYPGERVGLDWRLGLIRGQWPGDSDGASGKAAKKE